MWEIDYSWEGFEWLVSDDCDNSVAAFMRTDKKGNSIAAVCNFTPVTRKNYRIGIDRAGTLTVILNSDDAAFGGKGEFAKKRILTKRIPMHGKENSFELTLPGLSCIYLKYTPAKRKDEK